MPTGHDPCSDNTAKCSVISNRWRPPATCCVPRDSGRDVQILAATSYGKEDIYNGGLHQFYMNGTGTFAPEMVEFFERSGNATADVLRKSMEVFGETFPRSQSDRQNFLEKFPGQTRKEFDPFTELDTELYASIGDRTIFTKAKNDWLSNVCKINRLSDPIPNPATPEGRTFKGLDSAVSADGGIVESCVLEELNESGVSC